MKQHEAEQETIDNTEQGDALRGDVADADKTRAELLIDLQALREQLDRAAQSVSVQRGLFDGMADGVIVYDADGRIIDVNRTVSDRLGYRIEDLRTMHLRDIVSPELMSETGSHAADALAGQTASFETTYLSANGDHVTCSVVEKAVECDGRVLLQAVAREVSGETARPQDIEVSEEKYRTIFEDSLDAKSLIQNGKVLDVNAAWLKLHGFTSKAEVIGTDVMDLVHEDDQRILARRRKSGPPELKRVYQLRDMKKDGGVIDVELYSSTLTVNGKQAIISTVRDITERKRIEREREQLVKLLSEYNLSLEKVNAELERSNKELQDFAHIVSHDLQEPLRMVSSYLKLLTDRCRGKLTPGADEFIGFAVKGADSMQHLIADLLDYAQVDAGTKEFKAVDVNAVIEHVLTNLHAAIEESGAAVLYDAMPIVMGDALQFGQLLQNLIGNAIKFRGEAPPRVRIAARKKDDVWLFSVKDNGIGIEQDYAQKIFTIFQRLHSRKEYPGSGIGLSICKKIVECHGGRIWADSTYGEGSTFYFTIPAREEEKKRKETKTARAQLHVLLVDDSEGDARLVQETIKDLKMDIQVTWVQDGFDAMAYLRQEEEHAEAPRPDLILLDLNMPKKNGHEVLAEIKASEALKQIPVAVVTSSRDRKDVLKSGNLHATWYITKPVDLYQLMQLVDAL